MYTIELGRWHVVGRALLLLVPKRGVSVPGRGHSTEKDGVAVPGRGYSTKEGRLWYLSGVLQHVIRMAC